MGGENQRDPTTTYPLAGYPLVTAPNHPIAGSRHPLSLGMVMLGLLVSASMFTVWLVGGGGR